MIQMILVSVFATFFMYVLTIDTLWLTQQTKRLKSTSNLEQNTTTNRYTFSKLHTSNLAYKSITSTKLTLNKETMQKTMVRVCNTLYEKGLIAGCSNAQSVNTTWSFATDIAMQGNLLNVWNGTQSSTFSCGNEANYGRFLFHTALPKDIVSEYGYNLNGISDTDAPIGTTGARTYPCGYSEIIYKLNF